MPAPAAEGESGQNAAHKKLTPISTAKDVQGEISWMNKKYIAVSYNRDLQKGTEEEMLLPIDKGIKLEHKKSLSELKIGDTVRVQYQEDAEVDDQGNQENGRRRATVVSFIKAAANKPELSSAESAAQGDEKFEIKGTKGE